MYQFYEKRFDFTLQRMHTKIFLYKLQNLFRLLDFFREKSFHHFLLSFSKKIKMTFCAALFSIYVSLELADRDIIQSF